MDILADVSSVLAQIANAVVSAAATDAWKAVRGKVARLFGRGQPDPATERRLDATHDQLRTASQAEVRQVRAVLALQWKTRLADLLELHPEAEAELQALRQQLLEIPEVSATVNSTTAFHDAFTISSPGFVNFGNMYLYPMRSELPGRPNSLELRPTMLAGRENLLAQLSTRLARPDNEGPGIVALYGPPGVGKTSLALEYAHRHRATAGIVWQFPAGDVVSMEAEFTKLGDLLGAFGRVRDPRDPVKAVHEVLETSPVSWILIFDNAQDLTSIWRFLPPSGNGQLLITSQSRVWPPGLGLEVAPLDLSDAASFLANPTGDVGSQAAELALRLGGLALALEQARAYIDTTGGTVSGYLDLLRQRPPRVSAHRKPAEFGEQVAETWALAFARAEHDNVGAPGLLRLLANLAPEPVPLNLLFSSPEIFASVEGEPGVILRRFAGNPLTLAGAVSALARYSLLSMTDEIVRVHRLVMDATIKQMTAEDARQWRQAAAHIITAVIPRDPRLPSTWRTCEVLLPHAQAALDETSPAMRRIAQYLGFSGSYPAARDAWKRITDANRAKFGDDYPETLTACNGFAYWTAEAGDATAAKDMFEQLLRTMTRVLGTEHPDTLMCASNLAASYAALGDVAGARKLDERTLRKRRRALGESHPHTLASASNLAADLSQLDYPKAARKLAMETLSRRRGMPSEGEPEDDPDVLRTASGLATILGQLGELDDARELAEDTLTHQRRVLGDNHPDALVTASNLAEILGDLGDFRAAWELAQETVPRLRFVLGDSHPITVDASGNLARYQELSGMPAEP